MVKQYADVSMCVIMPCFAIVSSESFCSSIILHFCCSHE